MDRRASSARPVRAQCGRRSSNIPIPQHPGSIARAAPRFLSYGLGWGISDYQGHRIVSHGGYAPGSLSLVVLIPDLDVVCVMSGGEVQRISMRAVSPLADFSFDYPDLDFRPARK
jgi:hypothetical protein